MCPPMPRQDGIGDRAPTLCVVGCECLVKSSCVEVVDLCVDIGGSRFCLANFAGMSNICFIVNSFCILDGMLIV